MAARAPYETLSKALEGLEPQRPRATRRSRIVEGLIRSAPFSTLQRRIIFFNLIGLAVLVAGALYLNQFRTGLIEQRVEALRVQGEIIAITIAESAGLRTAEPALDIARANVVLNRLARPTGLRARLFDTQLRLTGDTLSIGPAGGPIEVRPLPAPGETESRGILERIESAYRGALDGVRPETEIFRAVPDAGISHDREVEAAARGFIANAVRVNAEGELIVSVALPVQRLKAVLGVLVLSTPGGDIDSIVRAERIAILQTFVVASIVSVALSVLLANTIARPLRQLADAAEMQGATASRPLSLEHVEIPDLTYRTDEIGELSAALRRMTEALYRRIEAIESFAADVSHEIKNPLTSLRSAVETMAFAKTPEQRERLLEVIQHDVTRLDRLVTDISNASRLDAELVRARMEPFDMAALIETLSAITEAQAEGRRVRVVTKLPEGGLPIRGLETRMAQVVTNLLDNALSFTPEGGIITVEGRRLADGRIRVSVADEGPGIPEANLESIFERFYSERPSAERFGQHSGLGLSISRQVVDAHGGRIWAENIRPAGADRDTPPKGARFVIELPA